MPVPTALAKATKVAVYRVGDDNKLVACGVAEVVNGKISFTTNHFSTYVFAEVVETEGETTTVNGKLPDNTNTGDVSPIMAMFALAAVAGIMVCATRKKVVNE